MNYELLQTVTASEDFTNFDYKKFGIYNDKKLVDMIFEHDGEFLTLHNNKYFPTIDAALEFLEKR